MKIAHVAGATVAMALATLGTRLEAAEASSIVCGMAWPAAERVMAAYPSGTRFTIEDSEAIDPADAPPDAVISQSDAAPGAWNGKQPPAALLKSKPLRDLELTGCLSLRAELDKRGVSYALTQQIGSMAKTSGPDAEARFREAWHRLYSGIRLELGAVMLAPNGRDALIVLTSKRGWSDAAWDVELYMRRDERGRWSVVGGRDSVFLDGPRPADGLKFK